jgi:DNA-binding MarR family transcriptional regulator
MTVVDTRIDEAQEWVDRLLTHWKSGLSTQPLCRDVSLTQFHLLTAIQARGSMTVSELAALLGVSPPSATAIIDRMEKHGLVGRERDARDRRVVHVRIRERGLSAIEEVVGVRRERIRRLLLAMTDEELENVIGAARAIGAATQRLQTSEPA